MNDKRRTYYATHKDGSKQEVKLIYEFPDPNYWLTEHEKFINRNKRILQDFKNTLAPISIRIDRAINEFIYRTLPTEEKYFYVEPINNNPFNTDNCFYIKGKFLSKK
ncbi:MAG TPA: hypothetical protein PK431_16650 [Chitinophagales bacterium]|nr:hypothetical protein [Chitinophagales bacterium]